jgi:predicted transposase YdaD
MYAEFTVIRIWEVPVEDLMKYPGLLAFSALGKTDHPEQVLRSAVRETTKQVKDIDLQHEILGAAYLLSGLVLDKSVIGKIIRRDVMRESVTYQAVLEEGREEGRLAERRSMVMSLLQEGMAIDLITRVTGWSVAEVTQLKQDNGL